LVNCTFDPTRCPADQFINCAVFEEVNGSVKEPNKFHNYETEKITGKASDAAEYIKLFSSSTRDHHVGRINVIF